MCRRVFNKTEIILLSATRLVGYIISYPARPRRIPVKYLLKTGSLDNAIQEFLLA